MSYILVLLLIVWPLQAISKSELKVDNKKVITNEALDYKISWGILTIGSGSTSIDRQLHRIGSRVCYKIEAKARTNGLAKIFYLNNKWVSYVDTATINTQKSFRSIREIGYNVDEEVIFDTQANKAEVRILDKSSKAYTLQDIYDTPGSMHDVVAGFLAFRLIDLSKFQPGKIFLINGFYKDTVYKMEVLYMGTEFINTESGKILCYSVQPLMPKNKVFDGEDAVKIWLSADKTQTVTRIRAKLNIATIQVDLKNK